MNDSRESSLPQAFLERMKKMPGLDYDCFIKSYENPRTFGLRVNTAKISCEEFERLAPFPIQRIPWVENGYFYGEKSRPAACPYYYAGLYYLQEPSAMTPASRLPAAPGDFVLDLCAAPGGKATALGAALRGQGLLVANDISTSRARALLRNLELFGVPNLCVTDEKPEKLARSFPAFFHKIILDAPCSGEGMFRKEESLIRDWSPEKSRRLAQVQRGLLDLAVTMLRPGGMLMYSTCTFAPEEDEGAISFLLERHPEMTLLPIQGFEGFSPGIPEAGNGDPRLTDCVRIFPHKMQGEGHFMALLKKDGPSLYQSHPVSQSGKRGKKPKLSPAAPGKNTRGLIQAFLDEAGITSLGGQPFDWSRTEVRSGNVYYLPPAPVPLQEISFLRNGLFLGEIKKNRFEPGQPLALALHRREAGACISLPAADPRLMAYLRGEALPISPGEAPGVKGWHLLCADGFPIGFGKLVNGVLKNKYPAGWRIL
ncbi:MAG: RsmB/NOP family class I SAM-dependent RNA methyltransferase [Clostridiales bacterium]|nr:RsmB/NOP family class I SAM-dependent RNA methyltransferase [Clostridiales bacterium]